MIADALELTTYFSERRRAGGRFVADALLDLYERHGVGTSVLLRGAEGFGHRHQLHTDRLLTLSEDLPLVAVAVDERPRIAALLKDVMALEHHGVVTLARPAALSGETKLTVYVGRQQRIDGAPAFLAICDLLRRRGIAGATALLGVDGTLRGERRRARFFARNADVPMMIVAVGSGERIAAVLPEVTGHLHTLEHVRICKRDGELLGAPEPSAGHQKLTVYTSEHSSLHLALVHRLRASGASGVTCLRGIWGFHGDHPPHGDRLLQLRRHVPVVTVIVDSAEGIARSFAIVDEVTRAAGLVTSETLPEPLASTAQVPGVAG